MIEQPTAIGDQIKHLVGLHMQRQLKTDLPPMIGAFTLTGEYTDPDTGRPKYVTLTAADLAPWTEIGLLEARLVTCKQRWAGRTMNQHPEEG